MSTVMSGHIQDMSNPIVGEESLEYLEKVFPSSPGPVQIIEPAEKNHTFKLNVDSLEKILLDPKVADKKVSVIGVAGRGRGGKSFLLNFFLRYLKHKSLGDSLEDNWLEAEPSLLGFNWRSGYDPVTSGIVVWSEPFIVKDRNGEEIAILLMDTQGTFNLQSSVKDCAVIFALSTMISSVQIYNLSHNFNSNDLQYLQYFTEYGRLVLEDNVNVKPFQSLLFLVRDWDYPDEAEYGFEGGKVILDEALMINEGQHPELQQIRRGICNSFDDIQCYLMPHLGLDVATSAQFMGELKSINDEFQQHLRTLVPRLLHPDNVAVKCINGQPVTCRELVVYFKTYMEQLYGEDMPEPKSMLSATAEANNLAAVASAEALYTKLMEEVCGGDAFYMSTADLQAENNRCKGEAVRHFKTAKKMGGSELSYQFLERLEVDIAKAYESILKVNDLKDPNKLITPFVHVCVTVVLILESLFGILSLKALV